VLGGQIFKRLPLLPTQLYVLLTFALFLAIGGLIGYAQWLVLRRSFEKSIVWVPFSALALAITIVLGWGFLRAVVSLPLAGTVFGALTSVQLNRILTGTPGALEAFENRIAQRLR